MHLSGSITALATPFLATGEIDFRAWHRLLELQVAGGTRAVVVAGSTGEASSLTDAEFRQLIQSAVQHIGGRIPVLAGTGLSNTSKTIAQTQIAADSGADVALVVTPPYVRPTQAGLIAHFTAVAEQGGLPIVLYNVPSRTGCDLLPETVAQLSAQPNIIGLKEAVSQTSRWEALFPLGSPGFSLLSGDDPTFVQAMRGGATGVISVASNVVPATFALICRLIETGHGEQAAALDGRMLELYDFLGIEPNPIPIKAILQRLGFGEGVRLPLLSLSSRYGAKADAMASLCRSLESGHV